MALYKAYGNQLVDSRTAMTMVARGQMESYEREFATPPSRGEVTPFVEIGIGKPLAMLLIQHWATVTVCDLHTKPLSEMTLQADILCSATGVAGTTPGSRADGIRYRGGAGHGRNHGHGDQARHRCA